MDRPGTGPGSWPGSLRVYTPSLLTHSQQTELTLRAEQTMLGWGGGQASSSSLTVLPALFFPKETVKGMVHALVWSEGE